MSDHERMTDERLAEIDADLSPGGRSHTHESDLPLFGVACELFDEVTRMRGELAEARATIDGLLAEARRFGDQLRGLVGDASPGIDEIAVGQTWRLIGHPHVKLRVTRIERDVPQDHGGTVDLIWAIAAGDTQEQWFTRRRFLDECEAA